jgi:hypothetical protein
MRGNSDRQKTAIRQTLGQGPAEDRRQQPVDQSQGSNAAHYPLRAIEGPAVRRAARGDYVPGATMTDNRKTSDQLKAAGYEYDNDATCRGCGEPIEWWITPKGKKMPMTVIKTATIQHATADVREPHWASCTARDQFRR